MTVDEELRRFQYRIVEGPTPLEFHLATVDVLPDADGSLEVDSTEVPPDHAKVLFDAAIAASVAGLKAHLER